MSYTLRRLVSFVPLLLLAAPAAAAQANGLGILSIPERQPISCETVEPKYLAGAGVVNRRFRVGRLEHIGGHPATPVVAPRDIELMTDASGGVFLLDQVRRQDGADIVSVVVAPTGRPGLWRTITIDREKVRARLERGDFKSRPEEEGSTVRRELTSSERAQADSLAQWLLKRGCSP